MRNFIFVVLIFIISNSCYSKSPSGLIELLHDDFDPFDRGRRIRIAMNLKSNIASLRAFFPSLTSEQRKWLNSEKDKLEVLSGEALTAKMSMYVSSRYYHLNSLENRFKSLYDSLGCIESQEKALNIELYCWAYLTHLIGDTNAYNDALNGLSEDREFMLSSEIKDDLNIGLLGSQWGYYRYFGRLINEKNVLPLIVKVGK